MTGSQPIPIAGRVEFLNPDGMHRNPAFSQIAVIRGPVRTVYVGGQDSVAADGSIVGVGDLAAQTMQVLRNLETALRAAGAGLEDVVKWTILVVEGQSFEAGFAAFREFWGDRPPHAPLITAAVVQGLAHPDFLVEMDAMAVVPEPAADVDRSAGRGPLAQVEVEPAPIGVELLDRVPEHDPRHRRRVRLEEGGLPVSVPLAGLAQHPADCLLDQRILVVGEPVRDAIRVVELPGADEGVRAQDRGPSLHRSLGPGQSVEDVAGLVAQVFADDPDRGPIHEVPGIDPVVPPDVELEQLATTVLGRPTVARLPIHDAHGADPDVVVGALQQQLDLRWRHRLVLREPARRAGPSGRAPRRQPLGARPGPTRSRPRSMSSMPCVGR